VKDGILMVKGIPVAETEASRDPACPVNDSNLVNLLRRQSSGGIDLVGLRHLSSAPGSLRQAVYRKRQAGAKILIFDALKRQDLEAIAEAGFELQPLPLFIGSAGLAEAVATRFAENTRLKAGVPSGTTSAAHALVVCGSASAVSRRQLALVVQNANFPHIEIRSALALQAPSDRAAEEATICRRASDALRHGSVILSVSPERTAASGGDDRLAAQAIAETLGGIAASALAGSGVAPHDVALILTGGDTAMAVLAPLGTEGIEIGGELLEGIMAGRVKGGFFSGAQVVTKAGAFGKDDALLRVVRLLAKQD
jgi:D-threonate/D-erythronate kinase